MIISPPSQKEGSPAKAQAKIYTKGPNKGSIESIQLVDSGSGYVNEQDIQIEVSRPEDSEGQTAVLSAVLDMAVDRIEITKEGSGYAVEKPIQVYIGKRESTESQSSLGDKQDGFAETPDAKKINTGERRLVGVANPTAEMSSFTAFRRESDTKKIVELEEKYEAKYNLKPVSGLANGDGSQPPLPFWSGNSQSSELLRLLPAGVGLEYDATKKRYALAVDTEFMKKYPAVLQQSSNRPISPEFGPRGRSPIERNMQLGLSEYLRFSLSGAICASGVHLY